MSAPVGLVETPRMDDDSARAIADRAFYSQDGIWTRFNDHFFQVCCDCGLTHRVDVKRDGDYLKVMFARRDDVTAIQRAKGIHPLERELAASQARMERLREAARVALDEMCRTSAPRNSFTDAVDQLDAAIDAAIKEAQT